ncbi:MAG: FG-GAP repeat protein, partial [Candidatus Cloacimonetes bacterium]|nr:FG-GAP repeat protein [Candidatus Cloacimonadota bacterium]
MKTKLLILGAVAWLLLSLPLSAIDSLDIMNTFYGEFNGAWFGEQIVAMDFNGDGYDDLIVHAPNWNPNGVYNSDQRWGKLYFYWGGPEMDNEPDF